MVELPEQADLANHPLGDEHVVERRYHLKWNGVYNEMQGKKGTG